MSLANRLLELLHEERLSQTDFCARSGYSRTALSNFMTGRTVLPKVDLLEKVAATFPNVDLNWLVTGKGRMYRTPERALPDQVVEDVRAAYHTGGAGAHTEQHELQTKLIRLLEQQLDRYERAIRRRDPELARELGLEA